MIWKDRKYINPRKRVFKNMDTDEILNLEIQDDPENIAEESETPLNAHNLNLSQQQQLDDMSKTYTGTSITAPTVEGYGRINKIWGHTIEEGSGEKSPSNPYMLRCVGDDVNLFDANKIEQGAKNGITCTVENGVMTFNGTCTQDNTGFVAIFNNLVKNIKGKTNIFIEYISGTIENATNTTVYSMFQQGFEHQMYSKLLTQNMKSISNFDNNFNFYAMQIRFDNGVKANNYKIRVKVSQVNTDVWSPYNYGTVEIISQNEAQQSSNVVVTKPLCCLKDGDNIIAQDWIDYGKGVVHRECTKLVLTGTENIQSTGSNLFWIDLAGYSETRDYIAISNKYKYSIYENRLNGFCMGLYSYADWGNARLFFHDTNYSTVADFKAYLANQYANGTPVEIVYELAIPTTKPINCSNKIVQYSEETTIHNRDNAEIEVSLTNNKAISEVNEDIGSLQEKVRVVDLISKIVFNFSISENRSQFKKVNNVYNMNLFIGSNTAFNSDTTIATIPVEDVPNGIEFLQYPVMLQDANSQVIGIGRASINSNGQISLHHNLSNVYRIVLWATYIK